MKDEDVGRILEKIDETKRDLREEIARLRENQDKIFERLDEDAKLGLPVRVQALEKRMDGFWGKVTGLISLIVAVLGGLFTWLSALLKGAK